MATTESPPETGLAKLRSTLRLLYHGHSDGALRFQFAKGRYEAVSNVALYWHFVDAVWLAVFTSLYVTPHLR